MKYILLTVFSFFLVLNINAQSTPYCIQGKFSNIEYYNAFAIYHNQDVVYGYNLNHLGQIDTLKMDIAYPHFLIDPLPKRPLVVLVHGGEFESGHRYDMQGYAESLAKKGFVTATVDYRLGWNNGSGNCDGDSVDYRFASYRALQDVKASIRFLVANNTTYKIDTNYIFLVGKDAGATTVLNTAFLSQAEADAIYPGVSSDLGKIDSATNTNFVPFTIKGIFSWSGGMLDTNAIQSNEKTPVLSIHGMLDHVMPIDYGFYANCSKYPIVYGPKSIYQRMKSLGICVEGNYDASGNHVSNPSLEEVYYIPEKLVCFFKKILCGNCKTEEFIGYNSFACSDEFPVLVLENNLEAISIFPNPASNFIDVRCQISVVRKELYNSLGQLILSTSENKIDVQHLSKGIYMLKLDIGGKKLFKKVVVE
jgi:acetyl esterase/lipase